MTLVKGDFIVMTNLVTIILPWPKKKSHRGDASCDIEESTVEFRCDASMREAAADTFTRGSAAQSSTVIPRYHKILILCISSMGERMVTLRGASPGRFM